VKAATATDAIEAPDLYQDVGPEFFHGLHGLVGELHTGTDAETPDE
jgi:hypothetical protein